MAGRHGMIWRLSGALLLALAAASAMKVPLSMGSTARECLQLARARGYGGKDFSGLLDAWCALADVEPPRLKRI